LARPSTDRLFRRAAPAASRGPRTLSPELEADAARRLGALALVVAIAVAAVGTLTQFALHAPALGHRLRSSLFVLDVVLSLALYAAISSGRLRPVRALGIGVVYEVARGLLSSLAFHSMTLVPGVAVRGWTPVAVWAMLYPLIVPSRPRRVLVPTLATAAMDPLGLWLMVAAGAPLPPASDLAQMFLPSAMVCVLAPIGAGIVYGLTVEVKRAREMGAYRLLEKLGQGGMGEVWRAEHRMLARRAAIKLIRPAALGVGDAGHAREIAKRFEREARATAALRSPHTIAVYDYGVAVDGTFHYVMELLEGYSLQALVDRFGPVSSERAVRFLRQACHSLAEAHAAGLVHRDVKPANIFVCRLGLDVDFVKVLDFGLVKMQGSHSVGAEVLTVQGTFAGTPGFVPPEVALGKERIDGRADIYALGCVAYWLLTGQMVFPGRSAMEMVVDHIRTDPVAPSRRTDQPIPEALDHLVLRCLAKDPAERPSTIGALSAGLHALGIEARWTEDRAREWWQAHPPPERTGATGPERPRDEGSEALEWASAELLTEDGLATRTIPGQR
jgi:serine/threonine-protein kinase